MPIAIGLMVVALTMAFNQMIHVERIDGIAYQKKVNNRIG